MNNFGGQSYPAYTQPTQEEKTLAIIAHAGSLLVALISGGVAGFLVPLIIYLMKKDSSRFAAHHALESLAFQVGLAIVMVVSWVVMFVTCGFGMILALPVMAIAGIAGLILMIIASIQASNGVLYEYPLTSGLIPVSMRITAGAPELASNRYGNPYDPNAATPMPPGSTAPYSGQSTPPPPPSYGTTPHSGADILPPPLPSSNPYDPPAQGAEEDRHPLS